MVWQIISRKKVSENEEQVLEGAGRGGQGGRMVLGGGLWWREEEGRR